MSGHVVRSRRELIELLGNGWEIALDTGMNGYWHIQQGGIGKGGESRTVDVRRAFELHKQGKLIHREGTKQFPSRAFEYVP